MINSCLRSTRPLFVKMSANVMLLSVFWKYEKKNLLIFVCDDASITTIYIIGIEINEYLQNNGLR